MLPNRNPAVVSSPRWLALAVSVGFVCGGIGCKTSVPATTDDEASDAGETSPSVVAEAGAMVARNQQVDMEVKMNASPRASFFAKLKGRCWDTLTSNATARKLVNRLLPP